MMTAHQILEDSSLNIYSLASSLSASEMQMFLAALTSKQTIQMSHSWSFLARTDQRPAELIPGTDIPWQYWLFLAGRGAGKTRAGAEFVRDAVKRGVKHIGLIAPTTADVRKVMVEGPSGILSVCWDEDKTNAGEHMGMPEYAPSNRQITWSNGAIATTYSAEEPDRLRGPQHELIWADELAAWQYVDDTWDMAMFGLRVGNHPQAIITTTPRPIRLIRELVRDQNCLITKASTYSNQANLAQSFIDTVIKKYEGTRLGRQELMGEIIGEVEGALWTRAMIEQSRMHGLMPEFKRIVIAIDPAVTANEMSNLTGIVAAGLTQDNKAVVIDDRSGRYSPDAWARVALQLYDSLGADRIVAEGNQGGDMVRHTIQTVRANASISIVHASRSKQARAEPVAALYEQNKVRHARAFEELEDQLCSWEPLSGDPSPDRLDALVWALTDLMLGVQQTPFVIPIVVSAGPRNIPGQYPQ